MKPRLTLEEYRALPKPDRVLLRRAAFGAPLPPDIEVPYDLDALKQTLIDENTRTGWFPEEWGMTKEEHGTDLNHMARKFDVSRRIR